MANRTLHLIVTDYDIRGFVRNNYVNRLYTPKLVEAVKDLNLEPDTSALFYTLLSDETIEMIDNSEMLPSDVWQFRGREFSDPYRRPDDHFFFAYTQPGSGIGVEGIIPWACRTNNQALLADSINQFHQILEGQRERLSNKVGVIIDCTDHPLMQPLLEGMGYQVLRQEVLAFGPWPERK